MKASLTILILAEAARQAGECEKEVSYNFDDFTNVMEWED